MARLITEHGLITRCHIHFSILTLIWVNAMKAQTTRKLQEPTNSDKICQLLAAISDDSMGRMDRIFQQLSVAGEPEQPGKGAALN